MKLENKHHMLSIAVKNAILVILVVLIIHFLLKKYLLERQLHNPKQEEFTQCSNDKSASAALETALQQPVCSEAAVAPQQLPTPTTPVKNTDEAANELFKFVFDDDAPPPCGPPKDYIPNSGTIKPASPPKCQSINQDNLVINEYDNESALNGGSLFENLKGFDSMEADYMAL